MASPTRAPRPILFAQQRECSQLESVLLEVGSERLNQEDRKAEGRFEFTCADDGLSNAEKLTILTEEVGEVARDRLARDSVGTTKALRDELLQVAAVAVAWVESL